MCQYSHAQVGILDNNVNIGLFDTQCKCLATSTQAVQKHSMNIYTFVSVTRWPCSAVRTHYVIILQTVVN